MVKKVTQVQNFLKQSRNFAVFAKFALVILSAMAIVFALPSGQKNGNVAYAAPFSPTCEPHGYLFQYQNNGGANQPPTHAHPVDLVTNTFGTTMDMPNVTVNAVGYNVVDDYIYGWDNQNPPNTRFVRIHGDFTVEHITNVTGLPASLGIIPAGDVDNNGQYWFFDSTNWHRIDLTNNPATYEGSGPIHDAGGAPAGLPPTASEVVDIAYLPPTFVNGNRAGLYTIVNDGGVPQLYRMDISVPTAPTWEHIGSLGADMTTSDGVVGALYADALGVLYAGSNNGKLWRVIAGSGTLALAAYPLGEPGAAVNGNDGVRCANAYLPMDFGDAPSSYGTDWEDIGPLHLIGNFNESTSIANLMLGSKIDMEIDGFGNAGEAPGATQDDNNHQPLPYVDDEDSVQHIVVPPSPIDLKVPVTVTNNDNEDATLAGWIDTNGDGSFLDEQRVTQTIPANSGKKPYELTFAGLNLSSNTYARFRIFEGTGQSDSQLQPTGFESSFAVGEVEDYLVQVGSFSANKTADPPEGSDVSPGETLTYTLTITNTGTTDLVDLTVHDDLSDVLDDATMEGGPVVDPSSAGSVSVSGSTLEFKGDISTGQSATVTYTVKVKPADQLANNSMQNYVIAAHTNCHPSVNSDGSVTISHADCTTHHNVAGLADTGEAMILPLVLSSGLVGIAGGAFYFLKQRARREAASRQ